MKHTITLLLACALPLATGAQETGSGERKTFESAAASVQSRLEQAVAELEALREQIKAEKVPLGQELREREAELARFRQDFVDAERERAKGSLDKTNLKEEIGRLQEESGYLDNLLTEYRRNFDTRLLIAERQRYDDALEAARLATENGALPFQEVFEKQTQVLGASFERLLEALGGARFEGTAVTPGGLVAHGTFAVIGPVTVFRSQDGSAVGIAAERLNSNEPTLYPFKDPAETQAAADMIARGEGLLPLDPTLGNAHKIESTNETFVEHVKKGGPVMIPIFALAAAALLVALYKWLRLAFLRRPAQREVEALFVAVRQSDVAKARSIASAMRGPTGRMLEAGARHLGEPRDLIEEVMYELVLKTRLQLNRMLPFIAISASSAPLLGLLGTVTGIINTFKLITVYGSGDVKTLSGGISEALITTEYGLIVAIPSLLLHSFLSRKARGAVNHMETTAVTFMNEVNRSDLGRAGEDDLRSAPVIAPAVPDSELVRTHVKEVLSDLLVPLVKQNLDQELATRARSRR